MINAPLSTELTMLRTPLGWIGAGIGLLTLLTIAGPAAAQPRAGEVAVLATGGSAWFLDGPLHSAIGGSVRAHFSDRFAIEPEFVYFYGSESDRDQTFLASLVYNLRKQSRVTPFLAAGLGLFRHEDASFSTTGPEAVLGVGVRVDLTDRVFVEPRFRIGMQDVYWSLTGSVGFVLSGR